MTAHFDCYEIAEEKILASNSSFFSFITPDQTLLGAALIVPKSAVQSPLNFNTVEWGQFGSLLEATTCVLKQKYPEVKGFNIGWNVGEIAGQTISHCHCHVIPRFGNSDDKIKGKGLRYSLKSLMLGR